jgi:hypothetical protein
MRLSTKEMVFGGIDAHARGDRTGGGRKGLCVGICQYYETSLLCAFQAEFFKAQGS